MSSMVAAGLLAGSAVGVAAQEPADDQGATAWVTGTIGFAPSCEDPTISAADNGVTQARGYRCTPQAWASDDARLGGVGTVVWNS
ncbi:MAG: hypothetical protein ACR2N9_05610, partial [Acidimicrobiia bacterium]